VVIAGEHSRLWACAIRSYGAAGVLSTRTAGVCVAVCAAYPIRWLVWRHQEFSSLMLSLFNAGSAGATGNAGNSGTAAGGDGGREFSYRLRRARLDLIVGDPRFALVRPRLRGSRRVEPARPASA